MFHEIVLLIAAFGIGVTLAAPGGPVNIMCVQRGLERGFHGGIAVGLGAVLGDGMLALVAVSGLSFVHAVHDVFAAEIQIIGGCILLLFGLGLSRHRHNEAPAEKAREAKRAKPSAHAATLASQLSVIPKSFLMTVTNPAAMLGAFALLGGLASVFGAFPTSIDVAKIVLAVMAGNLVWWFGLSYTVSRLRHRVPGDRMALVNRFAGHALMVFGGLLLARGTWNIDPERLHAVVATL
ncbi:MAG: LysE family transporter [Pseudomonadota bacterium]